MEKEPFEPDAIEKSGTSQELQQTSNQTFNWKREVIEWVQAIVLALVIALFIRTFIFSLIKVQGNSMLPTLHNNDRLVVVRLMYKPKQGDVVIFRPPLHKDTPYVKRVIALPGQTVDIDFQKHQVIIDGEIQNEDYINELTTNPGNVSFPQTVPDDTIFVLGDNRNNSRDSRHIDVGMIPYKAIMGRAVFRIWPLNNIGILH